MEWEHYVHWCHNIEDVNRYKEAFARIKAVFPNELEVVICQVLDYQRSCDAEEAAGEDI